MSTNAIAVALQAKLLTISGIESAYAREPDAIGAAPAVVTGDPVITPDKHGGLEIVRVAFPLRVLVERKASDDLVSQTLYDLVDALIAEFRDGLSLGSTVDWCELGPVSTNLFTTIGQMSYRVAETTLTVLHHSAQDYSPN